MAFRYTHNSPRMWNADLGWDGLCGSALPLEGSNIPSFNSKVWAFCADLGDGILGGLLREGQRVMHLDHQSGL